MSWFEEVESMLSMHPIAGVRAALCASVMKRGVLYNK